MEGKHEMRIGCSVACRIGTTCLLGRTLRWVQSSSLGAVAISGTLQICVAVTQCLQELHPCFMAQLVHALHTAAHWEHGCDHQSPKAKMLLSTASTCWK